MELAEALTNPVIFVLPAANVLLMIVALEIFTVLSITTAPFTVSEPRRFVAPPTLAVDATLINPPTVVLPVTLKVFDIVAEPVTANVFDNEVAFRTARVPSVSMPARWLQMVHILEVMEIVSA